MHEEAAEVKAKLLVEIEKDRSSINEQIGRIKAELDAPAVPEDDDSRTQEQRYRKRALEYFLQKNEAAAAEIDEYIKVQLENASLCLAIQWRPEGEKMFGLGSLMGLRPPSLDDALTYSYRFRNRKTRNFDPDLLEEMDFRFLSLPVPAYYENIDQIRAYYKDREVSGDYYQVADWYIEDSIIPRFLEAGRNDIHVAGKGDLVEHIVERFKERDYISLSFILPPFIEGTIHGICQTLGLKESMSERAALNQLLKTIQKHTDLIGMEYLLFIMPIRRNRIAHGRDLYASYREVAVSFMLDLDLLLVLAKRSDLPLNGLLDVLRQPTIKKVKKIFIMGIEQHHARLESECRALGQWINTDEFWSQLDKQLTQTDVESKETQRFVSKLEYHSVLFGDDDVASQIKARGKEFLRTLPAARRRLLEDSEKRARMLESLKARLDRND
ncbi:Uncharacterized protein ALO80_00347 [Pseudomonas caricapapayae]|uniref:Uncharacterized protein n=1 Tax=Pseudomonas caricapapayae TaxID=46678 RepID=A0A0P9KCF4_9PSED|nr:hypothetical protein [Pseudomonas caricapapayae]KAA8697597.1 hypothetical protein F4W67_01665 [Pseudomonas caricapapayae]KPW53512.1 Uncharacterized protein ALO80_00347 [Pseudomonas caricapapayae]RMM12640.1 hypothetical protein ALQ84_01791 [Pseudomonas caricapapayae]